MPDMSENDSATLARIDERTRAHGEAFTSHVKEDHEKFDKVFDFCTKRFDKIDAKMDRQYLDIVTKLTPLQDESAERRGGRLMARLIAGGGYSVMALLAGFIGARIGG